MYSYKAAIAMLCYSTAKLIWELYKLFIENSRWCSDYAVSKNTSFAARECGADVLNFAQQIVALPMPRIFFGKHA